MEILKSEWKVIHWDESEVCEKSVSSGCNDVILLQLSSVAAVCFHFSLIRHTQHSSLEDYICMFIIVGLLPSLGIQTLRSSIIAATTNGMSPLSHPINRGVRYIKIQLTMNTHNWE